MSRVKRGVTAHARHKKVLKLVAGPHGVKTKHFRSAHQAMLHSLSYQFRDRRARTGRFPRLWLPRLYAAVPPRAQTSIQFSPPMQATPLTRVRQRLAKQGLGLALSEEAKEFIGNQGYDPVYGARPLKRAIQHSLLDPLSLDVLDGKFVEGDVIQADVDHGHIVFRK